MDNYRSDIDSIVTSPRSLAALAGQLRAGPLQELAQLQREAALIAARTSASPGERLADLERLVRLSLSAMQQFRSFTRDLQTALRDLTDPSVDSH
jgi:hypothetical protein